VRAWNDARVPCIDLSISAPVLRLLNRKTNERIWSWTMNALRQLGPYLAIELILPGGSLIALALWLYRRYGRSAYKAGLVSGPE